MALTTNRNPWFISSSSNTPPPVRVYPWGSSEGLLHIGAAVLLNSDGKVNSVAKDGPTMLGYLIGLVDPKLPWPVESDTLTDGVEVRVAIVLPGDLYGIYAETGGSDVALTQANVGDSYGIRKQTSGGRVGYYTMCLNCTDPVMFTIVDLVFNVEGSRFALADNPGVAIVKHTGILQG
jgi:hypothetical protein